MSSQQNKNTEQKMKPKAVTKPKKPQGELVNVSSEAETEIQQFVVFQLEREEYGIPILQVRSVEKLLSITHVPKMPNFLKGVVNLRGDLVPVIDLRERFGVKARDNEETRVVISKPIRGQVFGVIVDLVSEIIKIPASDIDSLPPSMARIHRQHLLGAVKLRNRLIVVLDLHSILSEIEQAEIVQLQSGSPTEKTPKSESS
jgi:purine-binding chemotaxis protein CheW